MARGGKREGAGRKKGTPNRLTLEFRQLCMDAFQGRFEKVGDWIDQTALTDPARAAELTLRFAEFFIPKVKPLTLDLKTIAIEEIAAELERREALETSAAVGEGNLPAKVVQ